MQQQIKVIILTDNLYIKKWVADIVEYISTSPSYVISGVIINNATKKSKSSVAYKFLRLIDRKIFKTKSNPFQTVLLPVKQEIIINTIPIQKEFSDWLDKDCLDQINNLQPDLILRFGFRILRGDILKMPRLGVWSLHHGDNKVNRGGPPGFWEVVNQEIISGVTLQKITEDLDGGAVIGRAFIKSDLLSFHRNQVNLFETGVRLFQEQLNKLVEDKIVVENTTFDFYNNFLYKDPSNIKAIKIAFIYFIRVLKRRFYTIVKQEQWIISHSKINNSEESIYRFKELVPPKGLNWADPFPMIFNNKLWLFVEEFKTNGLGKIICFEYLNEKKIFANPKVCIEEKFHLSYPYIFNYENNIFMIPETGDFGNVIIYKSISFPYVWEKFNILIPNKKLYDVTPFQFNGKWYCFASERSRESQSVNDLLNLYILENGPLGSWKQHPSSPIKIDVRGGRSAGKIFEKQGKTYRPAQLGAPKYGYAIQIYQIIKLDENIYEELLVDSILPKWKSNLVATHTYNQIDGWQFIDAQQTISK
jgi:hypothetical protein